MRKLLIRLNNRWARARLSRLPMSAVVVLLPHCLQNRECARNVLHDLENCARCGRCDLAGILDLRERYGVRCVLAAGGRQALRAAKDGAVRGIVAVACEPELLDGIRAVFPIPARAVPNLRPEGPCRNTRVDLNGLEQALKQVGATKT